MDWDWPMYRRVERQATRMADMMQRLDVDTGKLVRIGNGFAYADARLKCLNCRNATECLLWLDAKPASSETPTFCPSFSLFEACKRQSAVPASSTSDDRPSLLLM